MSGYIAFFMFEFAILKCARVQLKRRRKYVPIESMSIVVIALNDMFGFSRQCIHSHECKKFLAVPFDLFLSELMHWFSLGKCSRLYLVDATFIIRLSLMKSFRRKTNRNFKKKVNPFSCTPFYFPSSRNCEKKFSLQVCLMSSSGISLDLTQPIIKQRASMQHMH